MPFIVFEGLDGSGKSSLMSALDTDLTQKGLTVLKTREPGGTDLGDQIRELILRTSGESPTARTELLLYEASRAQHVDKIIKPNLTKNKWVLCDRFTASSVAFQAGGREISEDWVDQLNLFATDGLKPDLTVLLNLSVEESRKRRKHRQTVVGVSEDRMESEADSFHLRVQKSFLSQAQSGKDQWLILDASKPIEELLQILLDRLKGLKWLRS
jgi:dTMP kinase